MMITRDEARALISAGAEGAANGLVAGLVLTMFASTECKDNCGLNILTLLAATSAIGCTLSSLYRASTLFAQPYKAPVNDQTANQPAPSISKV